MIHVYYAKTDFFLEESIRQKQIHFLCKQRRDKILRCKNSNDQARSMTAGFLLRHALLEEGLDYQQLNFVTTEHGKIQIQNYENYHVNLTHAGEYAACVVALQPVGIDVEDRKRFEKADGKDIEIELERMFRIAKRCCTSDEIIYLENVEKKELGRYFTQIWTRKESYSKAKGLGMQIGFSRINTLEEGYYWEYIIDDSYWLCVATLEKEGAVTICDCTEQLKKIEIGGSDICMMN